MEEKVFKPAIFRAAPVWVSLVVTCTAGLALIYYYLKSQAESLVVSSNRVTYKSGLIAKDQTDLKLDRISQVRVDQSIFQRMMNTGDVLIYVSGDRPDMTARGFVDPNGIKKLIDDRLYSD